MTLSSRASQNELMFEIIYNKVSSRLCVKHVKKYHCHFTCRVDNMSFHLKRLIISKCDWVDSQKWKLRIL